MKDDIGKKSWYQYINRFLIIIKLKITLSLWHHYSLNIVDATTKLPLIDRTLTKLISTLYFLGYVADCGVDG